MPPITSHEEFDNALAELRKITEYHAKRRSNWLPRKFSRYYILWVIYLLTVGVLNVVIGPTRVMFVVVVVIAIFITNMMEMYRSTGADMLVNLGLMQYVQKSLMAENEGLQVANDFLRAELARRDS